MASYEQTIARIASTYNAESVTRKSCETMKLFLLQDLRLAQVKIWPRQ